MHRHRTALFLVTCAGLAAANTVSAQGVVVLDNFTIGNLADDMALSVDPTNSFNITDDLGLRAGSNLFHSFHSFNIENGETAVFSGDPLITTIISRVTGGSASLIDGVIRSEIDGAGFWFVNPTGLILGPNSMIDVGGAFNFGSADFISFSDGLQFSAVDDSVTLSVSSPRDFGFLSVGGGAGVLTLDEVNLGGAPNPDDESYNGLLYAGRQINVENSTVRTLGTGATQGDIEIIGGRISISRSSLVTSTDSATNAGAIVLTGSEIEVIGDSQITTETTGTGSAGAISIMGTESVTSRPVTVVNRFSGIESEIGPTISAGSYELDSGAAGDITIRGGDIDLQQSLIASVSITDEADNDASLILLDATGGSLTLTDSLFATSTLGAAEGGSITLSADEVVMTDVSLESISEDQQRGIGAGPAGSVSITGSTSVTMRSSDEQEWSIRTASQLLESGQPGDVVITGGTINLSGGSIRTFTDSVVDGHFPSLVVIDAGDSDLQLNNMVVETSTRGENDAGFITLTGRNVSLQDGTAINSDSTTITYPSSDICGGTICTELTGAAGEISIQGEAVNLIDASIAATTQSPVLDNISASIDLVATLGELNLSGSTVTSETSGRSNAGFINMQGLSVRVEDSTIISTSTASDSGAAGVIDIDATSIVELTSSSIGTDSDSNAPTITTDPMTGEQSELVGWIDINVSGGDLIMDDSELTAETSGASGAGFIDLTVGSLQLLNASVVSTAATGTGQGAGDSGLITVIVANDATIEGSPTTFSGVRTTAAESEGGNILLDVGGRLAMDAGLVEASAGADGTGGSVTVSAENMLMQESGIFARADDGDGGPIFLTITGGDELFVLGSESLINADSNSGNSGEIDINVLDVDLDAALQEQDANIVAAPELAADACIPSASGELSTFVQADEGGTPVAPDRYLTANAQTQVSAAGAASEGAPDANSSGLIAAVQSDPSEACR